MQSYGPSDRWLTLTMCGSRTLQPENHDTIGSILIIADDLTGAADSAVQFRQAGFSAVVLTHPSRHLVARHRAQVLSLSLNTRDASPATVRRIWERHAPTIRTLAREALVYQKIDSTLRGHPGLEVRLLLDYLGASAAIIVPAFPRLGRHTVDGIHRVHDVPLAETEYARTQSGKSATSRLSELFNSGDVPMPIHLPWRTIEAGAEVVAEWLQQRLAKPRQLITADAAAELHLDILTQAVLPLGRRVLLVGSAGWAEHLAIACKGLMIAGLKVPGVLGVVGSLSAVATRQVQVALQRGVTVVRLPSPTAVARPDGTARDWQALVRTLAGGRSAVIWTNSGDLRAASRQTGQRVLRALAELVRELLSVTPVSGLVIVGGETARTVFRGLHTSGLVLAGEVASGMPYGRLLDGPFAGLPVITKAGGFGADTTLVDGLQFLARWATQ
ncbi:MAG TPA: four-carbon acid sugar kinase family protein [Candidatus Tectomicrobia bacterium]|nr:four-carbon acid sugar kinase family protein [Candidatus Tectomicrobia bacterium]